MWRPVRIALTNMSSVQIPRPVLTSGVRFAAYEMPHGPENAVLVSAAAHNQGPLPRFGGVPIAIVSG